MMYSVPSSFGLTGPPHPRPTEVTEYALQNPETGATLESRKRSSDDVLFISSQPVKKHRVDYKTNQHTCNNDLLHPPQPQHGSYPQIPQQPKSQENSQQQPAATNIPAGAITTSRNSTDEAVKTKRLSQERRVTTGMVTIHTDRRSTEDTAGPRGVSLPEVLEIFDFNQPIRKSRQAISPGVSPKSLPHSVTPAVSDGTSDPEMVHQSMPTSSTENLNPVRVHGNQGPTEHGENSVLYNPPTNAFSPHWSMPTPTAGITDMNIALPFMQNGTTVTTVPAYAEHTITRQGIPSSPSGSQAVYAQPCRTCLQKYQQAASARAEFSLPGMLQNMATPTFSNVTSDTVQQHDHCMATNPSPDAYNLGPGFGPVIMPMDMNNFGTQTFHLPLTRTQPEEYQASSTRTAQLTSKPGGLNQYSGSPLHQPPSAAPNTARACAPPSQPTYRKPSPNLIVDIAETCQAKFPFEEVASRHSVSVDNVYEIFAAIIQVPLLRCPTDRRVPGQLARTRLKDYTKTKDSIRDTRGSVKAGQRPIGVTSVDIARTLGPIDLPVEFTQTGHGHM